MDQIKRRDAGIAYIADKEVMEQQKRARKLTQELNTVDRSDFEKIEKIVKELLGKSEGAFINPPFYCDYGFNIEVGKNFYANLKFYFRFHVIIYSFSPVFSSTFSL